MGQFSSLEGKGSVSLAGQGIYQVSATPIHRLGEKRMLGDRVFRYARATEDLAVGKLCTAKPTVDSEDTVTVAHPVGTMQVKVTVSAPTAANAFAEGYLTVDEGTGAGDVYKIKTNTAQATVGQAMIITLYDALLRAWSTADTDVTWKSSIYNVQESNIDGIEMPVGVPLVNVANGQYFWLQTAGVASVLTEEAFGNDPAERLVTIGTVTAGAVKAAAAGNPVVGYTVLEGAYEANKFQLIRLALE